MMVIFHHQIDLSLEIVFFAHDFGFGPSVKPSRAQAISKNFGNGVPKKLLILA
jgi:hypothetical protein